MFSITIPGQPKGWRQNHDTRGRFVKSYLVKGSEAWQKGAIARIAAEWFPGKPLGGAFALRVVAVFRRPLDFDCTHVRSCKCGPEKLDGSPRWFLNVPDATNCHKLAEDALVKAHVITDDRLVCLYTGGQRYAARGEAPHTYIRLTRPTDADMARLLEEDR